MIGKKNLPCENTLPPLEEKALNLGRIFDFILAGLCLFPMAKCLNILYQQRWRIYERAVAYLSALAQPINNRLY